MKNATISLPIFALSLNSRPWSSAFELAKLLNDGLIYNDILEKTGASSATISRVNRSLNYGMGAYRIIFDRMKEEEQKQQKEQQA